MRKSLLSALAFVALLSVATATYAADTLSTRLSGRILLQIEDKGQAWYVNPLDSHRYFLGRPDDAWRLMRTFGLGITNADFDRFYFSMPKRLLGRIVLKVQDAGKAYYVDPTNGHLYYLGRPIDALSVIRNRGLGITNADLSKIAAAVGSPALTLPVTPIIPVTPTTTPSVPPVVSGEHLVKFTWKYKNKNFYLYQVFSDALYKEYGQMPRYLTYNTNNPPTNLRESFYGLFLQIRNDDLTLDKIMYNLKALAVKEGLSADETVEFMMAFVQYMPYDESKLSNNQPNYIYETLYRATGVCSDKTFLALVMLEKLGYGGAVFDYPDIKHSAVAVSCPVEYSTYGSGYCFTETTNYFPIGVIPQVLNSSGRASNFFDQLNNVFRTEGLGKYEILQRQPGKEYKGIIATAGTVKSMQLIQDGITAKRQELDVQEAAINQELATRNALVEKLNNFSGSSAEYQSLWAQYEAKDQAYKDHLLDYQNKVKIFNDQINYFNQSINEFFQN